MQSLSAERLSRLHQDFIDLKVLAGKARGILATHGRCIEKADRIQEGPSRTPGV